MEQQKQQEYVKFKRANKAAEAQDQEAVATDSSDFYKTIEYPEKDSATFGSIGWEHPEKEASASPRRD